MPPFKERKPTDSTNLTVEETDLNELHDSLKEIARTCRENIDVTLTDQRLLNEMENKANNMETRSSQFSKESRKIRKKFQLLSMRNGMILTGVLLLLGIAIFFALEE